MGSISIALIILIEAHVFSKLNKNIVEKRNLIQNSYFFSPIEQATKLGTHLETSKTLLQALKKIFFHPVPRFFS